MDPLPAFKRNYLLCPVCGNACACGNREGVLRTAGLCQIVAAADPVSRLIEELESRFLVVTDVPPPLPTTIERSGPSSSRATQATGLEGEPSESSPIGSRRTSESSGETFQCYRDVQQTFKMRILNRRFLTYQTINTNLRHDDKDLHTDCREFIDYLGLLQKSCCKKVSKEITQKRHERLTAEAELATHDCTAVLRAAKEDFLAISQKMLSEKEVTTDECLDYMYYLQAPVILKQLQRPGVVSHMTVPEWLNKKKTTTGYTVVGVKEHKTSAQQVATFALSQEEDTWFELYYTIHNPSNDLQRLHISIARSAAQQKAETTDLQMDLEAAYNLSNGAGDTGGEEKVSKWISDQGWRSNIPSAAQFVTEWKPHGSVDTALDAKQIRRLTSKDPEVEKGLCWTEDRGKGRVCCPPKISGW
ncbi:hypothetical protein AMELA_G00187250 [Ameiurus melas]|uniref:Uncharacterized protein n=1 Tax=Ameiurus melas TaxID=219545 RepID=A0A7J6A7W7_AMEME|nr:hypothetical protein AMELA_G00187250 [Ameiurus melas]